jgi:hypothetical protein
MADQPTRIVFEVRAAQCLRVRGQPSVSAPIAFTLAQGQRFECLAAQWHISAGYRWRKILPPHKGAGLWVAECTINSHGQPISWYALDLVQGSAWLLEAHLMKENQLMNMAVVVNGNGFTVQHLEVTEQK